MGLLTVALLGFLAVPLTGYSIEELGRESPPARSLLPLYWLAQGVVQLGLFVLPGLIFLYYYDFGRGTSPVAFRMRVPAWTLTAAVGLAAGLLPLAYLLHEWNQSLHLPESFSAWEQDLRAAERQTEQIIAAFLSAPGAQAYLFNVLILVALPALGEELIFRGIVQRIFIRWIASPHVAIWISGALFSAIHMQWLGFFPRWLLGVELGYLAWLTGSLWPAVLSHATHNGLSLILAGISGEPENSAQNADIQRMPVTWIVVGLILAAVSLYGIVRSRSKPITPDE